jgi:uncharacterized integral membrane protein
MSERTLRSKLRITVVAVAALLAFVLIVQNQEEVSTRVLLWTIDMPRFVLLGVVFFMGGAAGYLVGRGTSLGGAEG